MILTDGDLCQYMNDFLFELVETKATGNEGLTR